MLGRWFFLAVVGIGLAVIVHGQRSNASAGGVTVACTDAAAASGDGREMRATIKWTASGSPDDQVWLDLSLTRAFVDGTWSGHEPLAAGVTSFTTDPLAPGVHYYYRVNALRAADWRTVAAGSFVADCPDAGASR